MRSIFPAFAVVFLIFSALPAVQADNDALKVIVLVDDRAHAVGMLVELTVLVYEGGQPLDPDTTPSVTVLSAAPRTVGVFKFDNGLFRGNFTIQASDVVGGLVPVEASATYGKSDDEDNIYDKDTDIATIHLAQPGTGALGVSLHTTGAPEGAIRPGSTVTVAADVTVAGFPAQPDGFNLTAYYEDASGAMRSEPVNASGSGNGRFEGTYALPQVTHELRLALTARARSGNDSAESSVSLDFNQFWVVYHNTTKTPTSTTFYLYAGDHSGKAVGGATVDLNFWPDGNLSRSSKGPAATTDDNGKARLSLEFEPGTRTLTLEGRVNASGKSQRFFGVIDVSTPTATGHPSTVRFEMVYGESGDLYTPGKQAGRQYLAFNNSLALRNADIYTYIVASPLSAKGPVPLSPVTLVAARPFITDAQGRVTVTFKPPSYDAYLVFYFKNATGIHPKPSGYLFNHDSNDGFYYSETADMVVSSQAFSGGDVKVQASSYRPGSPAAIKVSGAAAGAASAYAMLIPGNFDPALPQGSPSNDWQVWVGIASRLNRTSGGFSGSVIVPVFMPAEVKYTAVVFVDSEGARLPAYGTAVLTRTASVEPKVEGFKLDIMMLIIIVVVAVAAAGGGLAYRRWSSRPAVPFGVSKTIACPACGTSFAVVQGPQPVQIKCPNCGMTGTLPALQPAPAHAAAAAAAGAPTPAGGTRMSIPCPACGTVFEIVRGTGPSRIQCPSCGKSGIMTGTGHAEGGSPAAAQPAVQAQATAAGQAIQYQTAASAPPASMTAQAATDMPRPEPVVQTRTIACPQCKNRFNIEKREGPQQIKCPHCGREGMIGRPAAGTASPPGPPGPAPVQPAPVPLPAEPAPVPQATAVQPRPLKQNPARAPASTAGHIVQQPQFQPRPAMAGGRPLAPLAAAGTLITCPACRSRFPVSDPRRPIKVRCPNCGKEGTLRL